MIVEYLKKDGSKVDISQLKETMSIRGDKGTRARVLSLQYVAVKDDPNIPRFMAENGNAIKITENNQEIFFGYILNVSYNETSNSASLEAYDPLYYFKNKTVEKYKNKKAEEITKDLCSKFGIPVNSLATTTKLITKLYVSKNLYEIIDDAYSQSGKYYVDYYNNGLVIKKVGSEELKIQLKVGENLSELSHSEDATQVVNQVILTDDKGKRLGEPEINKNSIEKYGLMQETAAKKSEAKELLKGPEMSTTLTVTPGDLSIRTGKKVRVVSSHFDLEYTIASDTHTWDGENYSVQVTLDYEGA